MAFVSNPDHVSNAVLLTSFAQESISSCITWRTFPVLYFPNPFWHGHLFLDTYWSKFLERSQKSALAYIKSI